MQASACAIYITDWCEGAAQLLGHASVKPGYSQSWVEYCRWDQGLLGLAASGSAHRVAIRDGVMEGSSSLAEDRFSEEWDVPLDALVTSVMSCPICWHGEVCGIAQFLNRVPSKNAANMLDAVSHGFTADDEQIAHGVCLMLAQAIRGHQTKLQIALEQQKGAALAQMMTVGSCMQSLDALCDVMLRSLQALAVLVYTVEDLSTPTMQLRTGKDFEGQRLKSSVSISPGQGLVGYCAIEKRAIKSAVVESQAGKMSDTSGKLDRSVDLPHELNAQITPRGILVCPIILNDAVLGVVQVLNKRVGKSKSNVFIDEDLVILQGFHGQLQSMLRDNL